MKDCPVVVHLHEFAPGGPELVIGCKDAWPEGAPKAAEPMSPRYTIDHPFGSPIGWSVIRPEPGNVNECRCKTDHGDRE